jgi:hypothetical protein
MQSASPRPASLTSHYAYVPYIISSLRLQTLVKPILSLTYYARHENRQAVLYRSLPLQCMGVSGGESSISTRWECWPLSGIEPRSFSPHAVTIPTMLSQLLPVSLINKNQYTFLIISMSSPAVVRSSDLLKMLPLIPTVDSKLEK